MAEYLVLNAQNRQGTFTSSSIVMPDGVTLIQAEAIVELQAEYEDPANAINFAVFQSFNNGATWQHRVGVNWKGGRQVLPNGTVNPNPGFRMQLQPEDIGTRWRAEVDIPNRMRVGARVLTF